MSSIPPISAPQYNANQYSVLRRYADAFQYTPPVEGGPNDVGRFFTLPYVYTFIITCIPGITATGISKYFQQEGEQDSDRQLVVEYLVATIPTLAMLFVNLYYYIARNTYNWSSPLEALIAGNIVSITMIIMNMHSRRRYFDPSIGMIVQIIVGTVPALAIMGIAWLIKSLVTRSRSTPPPL